MTPARVTRAMYPKRTSVRVKRGKEQVLQLRQRARALLGLRVTGSQPSQIANTRMSTIPVTNSGIAASEMPVIVIDLSVSLP